MAITTFSAGSVLTASQMNALQQQAVMTFTTEAARDAALTSPTEGMVAYLTAPTVPAATGGTTLLPSGIVTAYNGTSWVCLTEVGARTDTSGTVDVNPYVALTGGGTAPTVTVTTGTKALVTVQASFVPSVASNQMVYMGVNVTGATTLAVSDYSACGRPSGQTYTQYFNATFLIANLNAGANTFGLQYGRTQVGGAVTFVSRSIFAAGLL